MKIIETINEWNDVQQNGKFSDKEVGFVPTMGALHNGHKSLIKRALEENEIAVVSIFVNPTQFDDKKDLANYPKDNEKDFEILQDMGVDYFFHPTYNELYPDDYKYKVVENSFSKKLCGASRPGHFDGVLTVVMKLLNIINPQRSYFGEKDYQQYKLVKNMCDAFFMSTEIILCPTVRDDDGLALSSRNALLTPTERENAALFPSLLKSKLSPDEIKRELIKQGFKIDYIEDMDGRRFGAVYIGNVRLIDNVQ